ncbi:MAG: hypothetical protein WCK48_01025 [bacterium]
MENDTTHNPKETPFLQTLLEIASIWIISDVGYYLFLPALGFGGGYTANPIQITIYYFLWLILTVFSFWEIYKKWDMVENRWPTYLLSVIVSLIIVCYLVYVFPLFPPITWAKTWKPASELLYATPWYFLPKSIDILLQQLLVTAMVLAFSFQKFSLRTTSIWCAILFGGAHLLLVFGGGGMVYMITFTLSAVIASFIFPYLILRVKNGFLYSYFLHWLFYAVAIILTRLLFKI